MKILKRIFWFLVILIFALLVVVFYQNRHFLVLQREALSINLAVWKYMSPSIYSGVYFLAFFLVGLLIAYFYYLTERFKAKNELKSYQMRVSKLEEEVKALKSLPLREEKPPSQPAENI